MKKSALQNILLICDIAQDVFSDSLKIVFATQLKELYKLLKLEGKTLVKELRTFPKNMTLWCVISNC